MKQLDAGADQGTALIRRFEGFSAKPYLCPAGMLTVGYGHVIREGEDFLKSGITRQEADLILEHDVDLTLVSVKRLVPILLTAGQMAALLSFTFNLGAGALQRSTLRRKILRGEHAEVPAEFRKWVWAGDRKLKGLQRRREAEALIYAADCHEIVMHIQDRS